MEMYIFPYWKNPPYTGELAGGGRKIHLYAGELAGGGRKNSYVQAQPRRGWEPRACVRTKANSTPTAIPMLSQSPPTQRPPRALLEHPQGPYRALPFITHPELCPEPSPAQSPIQSSPTPSGGKYRSRIGCVDPKERLSIGTGRPKHKSASDLFALHNSTY